MKTKYNPFKLISYLFTGLEVITFILIFSIIIFVFWLFNDKSLKESYEELKK